MSKPPRHKGSPRDRRRSAPRDENRRIEAAPPRPEAEVFEDLRKLAQSAGFLHALAFLIFKSNVITATGEFTKEDFLQIYDPQNLLRTEANLLIGLALSAKVDTSLPEPATIQELMNEAVRLLEELHQAVLAPAHEAFFEALKDFKPDGPPPESPLKGGLFLREAIFYGAESAFPFQYVEMAKERYSPDKEWLEANKGFNIDEAAAVMVAIRDIINNQYSSHLRRFATQPPAKWTVLPDFTFSLQEVEDQTGLPSERVTSIVGAFTTRECDADLKLKDSSGYNKVASHPLILLDDGTRLAFLEYGLFESLYEDPFYWIGLDKEYLGKHSQTRGSFVEGVTERLLKKVFGDEHVLKNVVFRSSTGGVLGEADAILIYGYRAFIIQAKSKKLTLASRAGDDLALGKDFQAAVQHAYDQALECIQHIKSGVLAFSDGREVDQSVFSDIREFYPICVTSEHYPALSAQVRELLKLQESPGVAHPIVLDVFTLDVLAEMLETPLYFTDYLVKRADAADRILATHELVILSWYLKRNLFIKENELVTLADDVLVELDLAMAVRRAGIAGQATPEGQLTRFAGTPIGRIIDVVNASTRPDVHRLGEVLLGMSGDAADALNEGIERAVRLTAVDGKLHDIAMGLEGGGGITVLCNTLTAEEAHKRLLSQCTMRKYTEKADRWYGVSLTPDGAPQFMLGVEYPWIEDAELEELAGDFRVRSVTHAFKPDRSRKIGRNERCPCGSGKKYKKCHGA